MTPRLPLATLLTVGLLAFPQSPTVDPPALSNPYARVAWITLNQGAEDNDTTHRKQAIEATGTIGAVPEAVKLVAKGLQDKEVDNRQTAAATLGQMGSQDAIPYLKNALEDKPEVAFTAARALWNLGDTTGRTIFQEILQGERPDGPSKMQKALKDAKKRLKPDQLALMGVSEAAGVLGPAGIAVQAVKEALKEAKGTSSGIPGRALAAEVLGKDSDPYALNLLEWALGDDNWAVRVAVCKALGERGNDGTIAKLQPLLNDDHHAVRYMAAASVVKLSLKNPSTASYKPPAY
jgi:HEAT repeat protein